MKEKALLVCVILIAVFRSNAQSNEGDLPAKVSHAEPIYFDLIRDLGARKGERELNVGMGVARHLEGSEYSYLIEYEFAPVNRVGVEVEMPFSFESPAAHDSRRRPRRGVEGIKIATQYSFLVCEKFKTTLAVGYIFEISLSQRSLASTHNPFFIVAKRWGKQIHSLLYAGPRYDFGQDYHVTQCMLVNASIHYVITGTKNFIGVEMNGERLRGGNAITVRPQVKIGVSPSSSLGLAVGVCDSHRDQSVDFLLRWIVDLKKKN